MDEPRASASPPSTPPPPVPARKQDTLTEIAPPGGPWGHGWRPADEDFSPRATAWRAWHALGRTERHKGQIAELRDAAGELRDTIDKAMNFLKTLWKVVRWAAALVSGAALLGGAGALARWLLTLHH